MEEQREVGKGEGRGKGDEWEYVWGILQHSSKQNIAFNNTPLSLFVYLYNRPPVFLPTRWWISQGVLLLPS